MSGVLSPAQANVKQRQYESKLGTRIRTFHCHRYSSCLGGTTLGGSLEEEILSSPGLDSLCCSWSSIIKSWVCSLEHPLSVSKARGFASSPKFCTTGMFFFNHRSLSVKRGPISCKATFSVDRNAYLGKDEKGMMFSSYNLPVSPEEQEIPLIMNGDDLAALKFGKWWKSCLKHSSDGMTQAGSKTIQYEFRVMHRCSP